MTKQTQTQAQTPTSTKDFQMTPTTFQDLGISDNIIQALRLKGYEHPTPIQIKTIPLFLTGEANIIGQAQTGTGKTAAFGVPIIQNITQKTGRVQAIILTPTRELALQVCEEMETFGGIRNLSIIPVFGGQPITVQLRELSAGADIVVGTPGRVIDLIHRKRLDISHLSYFVLDEADEMLNMGFIDDIKEIIQHTNDDKRMLCFSATMPKQILGIAKKYMGDYEMVAVEKVKDGELTEQLSIDVPPALKFEALCRVIDSDPDFYGLVFCARKDTSDEVVNRLEERGYDADVIHGDILQEQRQRIMERFRKQKLKILVATDVAARGIDVNELTHVVNYDIPQDPESYTHRIGRTGRAGKTGIAVTLLTPADFRKFAFIKKIAGFDVRRVELPNAEQVAEINREKLKNDLTLLIDSDFVETTDADPFLEFGQMLTESGRSSQEIVACLLKQAYENRILPRNDDKYLDEMFAQIHKKRRDSEEEPKKRGRGSSYADKDSKDSGRGRRSERGSSTERGGRADGKSEKRPGREGNAEKRPSRDKKESGYKKPYSSAKTEGKEERRGYVYKKDDASDDDFKMDKKSKRGSAGKGSSSGSNKEYATKRIENKKAAAGGKY
ncbi:DEAD/DEAH box helicase [Methanolapillus ohkumae]|uniref:RNA helicase n=1 Tax=Methanolapillus ohkumae TaxID=3028298 RepID=A0AA96V675_9EURY|nr:DEAD-box ATP-dependent RNA helicase CshA [Methanosarcinaceae archaeon Am2]